MSLIVREACTDLPALPPRRRRWERRCLDHDDRRLAAHMWAHDPERVANINMHIGASIHTGLIGWSRLFGDPDAVPYYVPDIVQFRPQPKE